MSRRWCKREIYGSVVRLLLRLLRIVVLITVLLVVTLRAPPRLSTVTGRRGLACRRLVSGRADRAASTSVSQLQQMAVNAVEREALLRVATPTAKHYMVHVIRTSGRLLQQDAFLQELNHLQFASHAVSVCFKEVNGFTYYLKSKNIYCAKGASIEHHCKPMTNRYCCMIVSNYYQ